MTGDQGDPAPRGLSRRELLFGGASASVGAAAGVALGALVTPFSAPAESAAVPLLHGGDTVPFHGARQAGIETPPQAHATFLAFDLHPETDAGAIKRMFRILSDDAARLTQGRAPLADQEPELATRPARLTITFAVGASLVARTDAAAPPWLVPLPPFTVDRLEPGWSDGDLVLQVCSDDPLALAHATRMLIKDSRAFATLRWNQTGFRRAVGTEPHGRTMRNLFGQVDGTVNPRPQEPSFDGIVWGEQSGWLAGGTSLIIRRIAMHLDTWDEVDTPSREAAVGRRLSNGAPLTGTREDDEPDFHARTSAGLPVISPLAHMRRARGPEQIMRRVYNYDLPTAAGTDAGLIFACFQADPVAQFVPIQRRLEDGDLLNIWTTPIGSGVYAVLPGCVEGGFVGETLFAS